VRHPKGVASVLGSVLLVAAMGTTLGACSSAKPAVGATGPSAESTPTTSPADPASPVANPAYGAGDTMAPVKLGKPAVIGSSASQGVTVVVTGWHEVTMPAGMPGEIAGPGLAFDVKATNNSGSALDLGNAVADMRVGADETPTMYTTREPTKAFSGTLQPGQSATATYAYNLDADQRSDLTFYVTLTADLPVLVFKGTAN
jgi:hypothetical protein